MNLPLVTIITPTYNCEKYIRQTIESVLDNGYKNIEYILIDDDSTDKTTDIIGRYKLPMLTNESNKGEQSTVNKGLKWVSGKYFMIVNADDPLLTGAIAALVHFMEEYSDELCAYPDWQSINEDGSIKRHIKSRDYDFIYMVKHHTCLPSVGCMFRSNIIKDIGYRDTSFQWLGDFDYWLRIGLVGTMLHVPYPLATWRNRAGQASKDKSDRRAQEHIRVIQKLYNMPIIPRAIVKVKREAICWSYLVAIAVTDSRLKMIYYALKALQSHPAIVFKLEFWDTVRVRAIHILRR